MAAARNPARGEDHYNAKLTADDVRLIRALLDERKNLLGQLKNLSDEAIAEKFEIHPNTVWKIGKYGSWIHLIAKKI